MTVKMFHTSDYPFTFRHIGPCPKCYGIALFPGFNHCMRLMSITPGSASVNKSLILSGNIRPVRRCDRYNDIRFIEFIHDLTYDRRIFHNTFGCIMTGPAPLTKGKSIIIYAYAFDIVSFRQFSGNNLNNLGRSSRTHRAAVNDQCFHFCKRQMNVKKGPALGRLHVQDLV